MTALAETASEITSKTASKIAPEIDARTLELRSLGTEHQLPRFTKREKWLARAEYLRAHILSVNGLLPMPEPAPLRARIFDAVRHEKQGYSVSKVYFQGYAGLLVTGNLFRPLGRKGPFPAVLNPHGHWFGGRLENSETATILGRGITFARQGYVAFCYSMIGHNDSTQLPHGNDSDRQMLWGFSLMSLQLYNSMRAVDFLQSLPDVDSERIGCTGESGGGTQTFLLAAVDPRIKVAAPVNMISAHFQGGCPCENGPSLRLNATNPEIGALMAPRPMLMVSATGDWTTNTPRVEYPFVKSIYKLLGAPERVECVQIDAPHNFNLQSRNAVYEFFGKWLLGKNDPGSFAEQPYEMDTKERYLVFSEQSARPSFAPEGEKLILDLADRRRRQIRTLWPSDMAALRRFQREMQTPMAHLLNARPVVPKEVRAFRGNVEKRESTTVESFVLSRPGVGDRVPAFLLTPAGKQKGSVTLVVSDQGAKLTAKSWGKDFQPPVVELLSAGQSVLVVCCWGMPGAELPKEYGVKAAQTWFSLTYNPSDHARRVQDILTGLAFLSGKPQFKKINLLGLGTMGPVVLLARTQAPSIAVTVADMECLRHERDEEFAAHLRIPGIRGLGGLATAAALIAPGRLCLYNLKNGDRSGERNRNESPLFGDKLLQQAYAAAGKSDHLRLEIEQPDLGPLAAKFLQ